MVMGHDKPMRGFFFDKNTERETLSTPGRVLSFKEARLPTQPFTGVKPKKGKKVV